MAQGQLARLPIRVAGRSEAVCRRCLLVEDSVFDQRRMSRLLEDIGRVDLTIVPTVAEAGIAMQHGAFDLVVLDNALPDGLGVDFALGLRKFTRFRRVPIILVTDFPSPFMYDKAMMARVSRVLSKSELRPRHICEVLDRGQSDPS